jgi:beta-aspartyl-dipeptidase (metallo-type)
MCVRFNDPERVDRLARSSETAMFILIENADIYGPEHIGRKNLLIAGDKIAKLNNVDGRALARAGIECDVIDGSKCLVVPGLIDPHQHLLGGSGESGFSSQTPEISLSEIVNAGITTVVGCLGADTTMKTMAGLLAKAKGLKEEGMNAFIWSGGYATPPTTITQNVGDDIMFIDEVIGAGEIAIADQRGSDPTVHEIARIASEAHKGGMLSRKAGIVHFHVGDGERRLQILRDVIEKHEVKAEWLYPTHVQRSEELMLEAIDLAKNGSFIDIDTVDEDLPKWLRFYLDNNGWEEKLTISSDAAKTSPSNLLDQVRSCVLDHGFSLTQVLRFVTSNTACALKIDGTKGRIAEGYLADILLLDKDSLEPRELISAGRRMMKDGAVTTKESSLKDSNREIHFGSKNAESVYAKDDEYAFSSSHCDLVHEPNLFTGDLHRYHECDTVEVSHAHGFFSTDRHRPLGRRRSAAARHVI